MKLKAIVLILVFALNTSFAFARQPENKGKGQSSVILEVEGSACMGQTRSRDETRRIALVSAKHKAVEGALSYIKSETRVKNGALVSDLINAYANAKIRIIKREDEGWYKEVGTGSYSDECYRVRIKAEVIPMLAFGKSGSKDSTFWEDPRAPLSVRLWTDKKEYKCGERVKIYFKGNKPFYAVIVYKDVSGNLIQLLPNPYRSRNYFKGGVLYELPSGEDLYVLEVCPPVGKERIIMYAATSPLGTLRLESAGAVYKVKDSYRSLGTRTRSLQFAIKDNSVDFDKSKAQFVEVAVAVKTKK